MKSKNFLNLVLCCFSFIILVYTKSSGQIVTVALDYPDTLKACIENEYRASFALTGTGPFTISIEDDINIACPGPNACNTNRYTLFELDTVATDISAFTYNYLTLSWEFTIDDPGNYSIPYNVVIDCTVLPSCFDSVATTLTLYQIWSSPSLTFNINSGGSTHDDQILYPKLVEITSDIFFGNYLDTISVIHSYKNTGNAAAIIQFAFQSDTTGCTGIVLEEILYGIGTDPNSVSYTAVNPGFNLDIIPVNEFLFINKRVVVIDCLDGTCNSERDTLIWKCQYVDSAFCDSCQNVLDDVYAFQNNNTADISVIRVFPDSVAPILDYSCMGEKLAWKYRIVNNSGVNIPEATVSFISASNQIRYLGLIDIQDIIITPYLSTNSSWDSTISVRSAALCFAPVDSPLHQLDILIHDFMIGDSIILEFETFRCCEEDSNLYNQVLDFGSGAFSITTIDSCNNPPDWKAVYVPDIPQWDMITEFFSPVSSLVVPKGDSIGPATPPLFVDFESTSAYYNSSYQLFGCPDSNCTLNGYLRVNIHCLPGLFVDTPLVQFLNFPMDPLRVWNPVFYHSDYTGSCDTLDYYYYFNLADTNANNLLKHGRLNFQLRSCCTDLPQTPYQVNFDILFNPDSCFTIDFSDTTHQSPPSCSSCCFMPVASTGDKITVNCPGCTLPGPEILSYKMRRLNYGLQGKPSTNHILHGLIP